MSKFGITGKYLDLLLTRTEPIDVQQMGFLVFLKTFHSHTLISA
jgi:hypothetical protein